MHWSMKYNVLSQVPPIIIVILSILVILCMQVASFEFPGTETIIKLVCYQLVNVITFSLYSAIIPTSLYSLVILVILVAKLLDSLMKV